MMKRKVVWTVLLCILLVFALTACGSEQTQGTGENVGGTIGGNTEQNGEVPNDNEGEVDNGGEETVAPGQKPFEQGDGESLKEFVGLWADYDVEYPVYIQEDGTWGKLEYDGKKAYGIVKYEDGKLSLAMEDDGYWEVIEYTPDQDKNLISEVSEPLYRYSWLLPEAEVVEDCYVGYWKDDEEDFWLCINRDATWYEVDASGKTVDEGYVCTFCMEELEEMIILVNDSNDKGAVILNESDDHLYGDRRGHNWSGYRTVSMPGNDQLSPVYVGTWMFTELDIAVVLREDSTWTSYSPYQELVAEGKLEPNQETNEITLAFDGKNALTFEMYNVDYMQGYDGGLDRLDTESGAELTIEERFLGIWQFDWLKQYIAIKEDGTWTAMDHKGNAVNEGTVVVKESLRLCGYSEDTQVIILMPDGEGYPLVLNESYGELRQMAEQEWHNSVKRVDEIPATAKYAGMYLWESRERYIYVNLNGDITVTYRLDGTYWDTYYSYYKFDGETGEMSMMISNNTDITLIPMAGGGWADASGNPQIVPVSFVPSFEAWSWGNRLTLPIEDAWYYEAKDVYLTFAFDEMFDGPEGSCLVMDENGKDIGRGKITYGPEAIYTVVVEAAGLNTVLTLDSDGKLTDTEGNELVKAHNMKYRN